MRRTNLEKTYKEIDRVQKKQDFLNNYPQIAETPLLFIVRSVSKSGMSRKIDIFTTITAWDKKPRIMNITAQIAPIIGYKEPREYGEGIRISGCGMDMCFWLADTITKALWPEDALGNSPKRPTHLLTGNGSIPCLNWQVL